MQGESKAQYDFEVSVPWKSHVDCVYSDCLGLSPAFLISELLPKKMWNVYPLSIGVFGDFSVLISQSVPYQIQGFRAFQLRGLIVGEYA